MGFIRTKGKTNSISLCATALLNSLYSLSPKIKREENELKIYNLLRRPRGMGWTGRREVGSGWGTHVNPWLIHVNIWQKPLQYCKVISLQLIKVNGRKNNKDI